MRRNEPGQTLRVFAFNHLSGEPKVGDAANITCSLRIDDGAATPLSQTNPVEEEHGYYRFDLTAAETDGDVLDFTPSSSTPQIVVIVPYYNRNTDAGLVAVSDILQADRYIDQSQVPWREVLIRRGTGDLSTGIRLLERELFTLGGVPVDSIKKFIASAVMPQE